MKKIPIIKSRRIRSTPFTSRIENQGLSGYSVYNHMLLPVSFGSIEEQYLHLKEHVQIWDVSVQREIEIVGKDSDKLVQFMTCRDLSNAKIGKCYYAPLIDNNGNLVNDPLIYKLKENKWRICIADSDVLLFAKGITSGKNFNVDIYEANINTIAIQGPKSQNLMQKVFGDQISELKFFNYKYYNFNGVSYLISKSGYSKQGGYEVHVENSSSGLELYDYFFKIGKDFNVKAGAPNIIERIEGGLLSYGNDIDNRDNPLECGFDKYVNLESDILFLGKEKLKKIKKEGIKKKIMGVKIDAKSINLTESIPLYLENSKIGELRSAAFSPKYDKIVGIAMVSIKFCKLSQKFEVKINEKLVKGEISSLPIT
tara:strand:- start:2763 stop:3869 length:1107 start_codon:yes stop_codon:yes gene_type:complete